MRRAAAIPVLTLALLGASGGTARAEEAYSDEAFFLLEEQVVTTASKKKESMSHAPAIMSVVTAEEIANMGVVTYLDVLKRVPGIDISITNYGQWVIGIRGIRTSGTEKVKLLIDGHSVNDSFIGSGLTFFDDLPVENIEKIEVIRGPGSALYGANAFVGVINIITRKGADIQGGQGSLGFGSMNTFTADALGGARFESGLEISGYAHYLHSDGIHETIDRDLQSSYDEWTGSAASLAPGRTTFANEKVLVDVNASYAGLYWKNLFGWREREDYLGLSLSLNERSELEEMQMFSELGYELPILDNDRLTSHTKVYFDLFDEDILWNQYPPGHTEVGGYDGDGVVEVFPEGKMSDVELSNLTLGVEEQVDIKLFEGNSLTAGFVYEHKRQFHVKGTKNQDEITGDALPDMVDFTDLSNWNRNAKRDIVALYLQDVWNITDSLGLTLGVRYDRYSDFGDTINPRAGLVWNFAEDGALKLLYGRAFRAPNFRELYDWVGSPDLEPEIINTFEVELSYRIAEFLKARASYYFIDIEDLIREDRSSWPYRFVNRGETTVHGVECELVAAIKDGSYAYVNYSFTEPEDGDDEPLADVANHMANVGFNLRLFKLLDLNANLKYTGERERAQGDSRRDLDDQITVDGALSVHPVEGLDLTFSVFNIFDADLREPAPAVVPDDYPMPGRTFFFRVRYSF